MPLTSVSTNTAWAVLSLSPSLFGGAVVADLPGSFSSFFPGGILRLTNIQVCLVLGGLSCRTNTKPVGAFHTARPTARCVLPMVILCSPLLPPCRRWRPLYRLSALSRLVCLYLPPASVPLVAISMFSKRRGKEAKRVPKRIAHQQIVPPDADQCDRATHRHKPQREIYPSVSFSLCL